MRLTTPPLEIDPQDPYKNDALNREQFGKRLINLITRTKEEMVICLNAPWGEGKTTFVRMWQGHLERYNIKSVYFDAFANDYMEDAFIALASEIIALMDAQFEKGSANESKISELKTKASQIGSQLLPWASRLAIKAATLNVIKDSDIEQLIDIKDDISKSTSNLVSKFIESRISEHKHEVENVLSFKIALEQLAGLVNAGTGNSLVIIIDELDRCKPTYAISIIERIKHLFSVKHLVFLLVMNKEQLEESLRCVYGQNIDAATYIQKFIHIDCSLPKNLGDRQLNDYGNFCRRLFSLHELKPFNGHDQLLEVLSTLAREFGLSLRQLEKTFSNISVFYASTSEKSLRLTAIISFLAIIKVVRPGIYRNLKFGDMSFGDFVSKLNLKSWPSDSPNGRKLFRILFWMKFCLLSEEEYKNSPDVGELNRISNELFRYGVERNEIIPLYCDIFDFAQLV